LKLKEPESLRIYFYLEPEVHPVTSGFLAGNGAGTLEGTRKGGGWTKGGFPLIIVWRTMPLSWSRLCSSAEQGNLKVLLLRTSQLLKP
jgi:hypothetical protein